MTAKTFTSAGVNNLWSNAANWDLATAPVDNDSVTIPTGQTCEFDVDMSSAVTWPNGIDGLTITSTGVLKLSRSTSGYLKIKAAKTITGTGTFDCGASSSDAIPFAVKHTVTGGAGWNINGASGLTMTVYAAEPTIKTIMLSGNEAIGQTELSVDTSVVGDIWADGDIIHIDDINRAKESEERTIAAGGIASGTITVTAGLTAAKSTGAVISLITRNVKFTGVSASICKSFALTKLTISGGMWTSNNHTCLESCAGAIINGGAFSGNDKVVYACNNNVINGGVFTGNSYVVYYLTGATITGGSFSGNSSAVWTVTATSISGGVFKGHSNALYICNSVLISGGTFSGNDNALFQVTGAIITGGTFSSNTRGIGDSSAQIKNASFSSNTTSDIYRSTVAAFNTLFSSTENTSYTSLPRDVYSESIYHDQTSGKFAAWTKGGVTASVASPVPTGYTTAYQITLEDANNEGFWQKEYTVGAGASVNITMNLYKSGSMTYLPRCIIFNKASTDPFAGGAGIHTFTMTDSTTTWESETYTYYNSTANDVTLVIRFQGKNASGTVTTALLVEQINVDLTTVINNLATIDTVVDAIKVDTTLALDVLMNKMITDPTTGIMTLYDDAGNPLLTAQLYEDAAGLQTYRGKGAERREKLA